MAVSGDVPTSEFVERRQSWHLMALAWHTTGVVLLLSGTLAGIALSVFADDASKTWIRALGLVSAAGPTIFALLNPIEAGNRYRRAWRLLDSAISAHKAGLKDLSAVQQAKDCGEQEISDFTISVRAEKPGT